MTGGQWRVTRLTSRLGVDLPLVQAPLGGGPGTPALSAAASEAGALGVLGGGYLDPDPLREAVREVRARTKKPFGVNVFLAPPAEARDSTAARTRIAQVATVLGLPAELPAQPRALPDHDEQVEVLLAEEVPVVTFTFGCPAPDLVRRLQARGVVVMVTVGTVGEARAAADAGADAVVAQGTEAGGHRGGWTGVEPPGLVALVPAVADAVAVPVVAAGGLMDGRGVVAALALGAQAAQLGTAFLRTAEAGTNDPYRAALRASEGDTVTTRAFSGRPARGLPNAYLSEFGPDGDLPDFPELNYLTRPLRTASAEQGRADAQSLWAGQGVALGRDLTVAGLVAALVAEIESTLERVSGR